MYKLLVLTEDAYEYQNELRHADLGSLEISFATSVSEADKYIGKANIILGNPYLVSAVLPYAANLLWVQSTFAGIDPLCKNNVRKDYTLTGVKDIFGPSMSEYIFAYILGRERKLNKMRENQLSGIWEPLCYRNLSELTIGIAGIGSIGKYIAKTASHFGMTVFGLKSSSSGKVKYIDEMFTMGKISEFLKELDYLVLTLPSTPLTKWFINYRTLKMMKKSSILMNIGRGTLVNEIDLISALNDGIINGAVLDVFENEPLFGDSPLWKMKNVLVTPHNSGVSFPKQITNIFCENYKLFLKNLSLNNLVNFKKGY
jgi:phosphoglycerate dehydrogenase-like enzyme